MCECGGEVVTGSSIGAIEGFERERVCPCRLNIFWKENCRRALEESLEGRRRSGVEEGGGVAGDGRAVYSLPPLVLRRLEEDGLGAKSRVFVEYSCAGGVTARCGVPGDADMSTIGNGGGCSELV